MELDRPDVLGNPRRVGGDQTLESREHPLDCIDDLAKCGFNGVLSVQADDSLLERYVKGVVAPHFHLWIYDASRNIDLGEYCVVLKGALRESDRVGHTIHRMHDVDFRLFGYRLCHREQFVFVSRIKIMKRPEGTRFSVPSHVRLQLSDFCDRIGVHPVESGQSSFLESERLQKDGPECLPVIEIATGESPSNVIENAPSVVNTVSNDTCPPLLRDRLHDFQPEEILALICVEFSDNAIGLRIEKFRDLHVKRLRMFFGATQLEPTFP